MSRNQRLFKLISIVRTADGLDWSGSTEETLLESSSFVGGKSPRKVKKTPHGEHKERTDNKKANLIKKRFKRPVALVALQVVPFELRSN